MKIVNKRTQKAISYFLVFLIVLQTTSCTYYKVKDVAPGDISSIKNIGELHKKMVIHSGDEIFILKDIKVDSVFLSGQVSNIDSTAFYYKKGSKQMIYNSKERNILHEVHFYVTEGKINPPFAQIPLQDIKEIRIIDPDTDRTMATQIFSTIAVLLGLFVLLMIVVALTKSSCPYVYVHDGESYIFEGETFGGAIAQNLERDDYMPLPDLRPNHGQYKLMISNELKEEQFTDIANLIVVNHPKESEVLLDKNGAPYLLSDKSAFSVAMSERKENLLAVLANRDRNVFMFNEVDATSNAVFLTYDKPADVDQGKLVLSAKNTLWFDYIFGEFLGKFGSAYSTWMQKQSKLPREERLKKVSENNFPLSIYLKKNDKWQLVEEIMTVGPLAYRDFVIPIDLNDISGKKVELKIETGFMFWELDAAAMDFSSNLALDIVTVKPTFANGTGAKDWTKSLMSADQDYMIQPSPGNITEITYKAIPIKTGYTQSIFLHTRGYYKLIRDFSGLPDISALNKFKTPGYFSTYSKSRYLNILQNEDNLFRLTSQN